MKHKPWIVIVSILVMLGMTIVLFLSWKKETKEPAVLTVNIHYFLYPNTTPKKFVHDLEKITGFRHGAIIFLLLKQHPNRKLQVGEYWFAEGSSAEAIVDKILNGRVMQHSFTLIEGWTIYQVMDALQQAPVLKHTLTGYSPKAIAKAMQLNYATPEGLLFPETYYYTWNMTDLSILKRAYQSMQSFTSEAWSQRAGNLPYQNTYIALIVASIVQRETGNVPEMPMISCVILYRLQANMPLQMDSTVIYGMLPQFSGKLSHDDLHQKTIYNTYTQKGLPPTPIGMPCAKAIQAALHPTDTDAWYFVAKGDGAHVFSKTLSEQTAAIMKYQKKAQVSQP